MTEPNGRVDPGRYTRGLLAVLAAGVIVILTLGALLTIFVHSTSVSEHRRAAAATASVQTQRTVAGYAAFQACATTVGAQWRDDVNHVLVDLAATASPDPTAANAGRVRFVADVHRLASRPVIANACSAAIDLLPPADRVTVRHNLTVH